MFLIINIAGTSYPQNKSEVGTGSWSQNLHKSC
jgi:hypothetical protein